MHDWRAVAEDGEGGRMTNLEKLNSLMGTQPIDEQAVGMLISHISQDIGHSYLEFYIEYYVELYRSMKDWLNSEVKE